ncbi:hypothetical protein Hanom_Chr02g00116901 [Helianthus anomalus]
MFHQTAFDIMHSYIKCSTDSSLNPHLEHKSFSIAIPLFFSSSFTAIFPIAALHVK